MRASWLLVALSCVTGFLVSDATARGEDHTMPGPPFPAPTFSERPSPGFASLTEENQTQAIPEPPNRIGTTTPVSAEQVQCNLPNIDIPLSHGCARGDNYPRCRARMPDASVAEGLYIQWRNTTDEHLWGRSSLVNLIMATALEYQRHYPDEPLVVGDLDAPGPRHRTHRTGVNVDLYLPDSMATRNAGRGDYPDNYVNRSALEVAERRARVESLARILAVCSGGTASILYNDEPVNSSYRQWYIEQGFSGAPGAAIQAHNPLHLFHFHVTVPEDLPVTLSPHSGMPSRQGPTG